MRRSPQKEATDHRHSLLLRALLVGSPYEVFAATGEGAAAVVGDLGPHRWRLEAVTSQEELAAALTRGAPDLLVVLEGSSRLRAEEVAATVRRQAGCSRCVLLAEHPLDMAAAAGFELALVTYGRKTALASALALAADRWWGEPSAPGLLLVEDDSGWAALALEVLQDCARRMAQRPRTLWARNYEEGWALVDALGEKLLLLVSDGEYPCCGRPERLIGLKLLRRASERHPGLQMLLVSADEEAAAAAAGAGIGFVGKTMDSPLDLLHAAVTRLLPPLPRRGGAFRHSVVKSPTGATGLAAALLRRRAGAGAVTQVGAGSLGGKGRGLAVLERLVAACEPPQSGVRLAVPPTLAIGSEVGEQFLAHNGLFGLVACASALSDAEIVQTFRRAEMPRFVRTRLAQWLACTPGPVVVRSSASLEDGRRCPLETAFATVFVGEREDANERLERVLAAISIVWASPLIAHARQKLAAVGVRHRPAMGVLVQSLVGSRHGRYFYPTLSGLLVSFNFYPFNDMRPEDGVAIVAMGLEKALFEEREGLRFCPRFPQLVPQHGSVHDTLASAQRHLWALDLEADKELLWPGEPDLVKLETARELRQGIGWTIASTYLPGNDVLVDGIREGGVPIVTFQRLLRGRQVPFAGVLDWLLRTLEEVMHGPVELIFAMDLERGEEVPTLWLLQCRPSVASSACELGWHRQVASGRHIVRSNAALGHGVVRDLRDVVLVLPDLDRGRTVEVASILEQIDRKLRLAGRPYLLVGPGRWGSRDRWLGIPVTWPHVSGARAIVETDFADLVGEPSQGSHFFHHLTAAGVPFLGVHRGDGGYIDWGWLQAQPAVFAGCEGKVRHLQLEVPLGVWVDGGRREGIVAQLPAPSPAAAPLPGSSEPTGTPKE